LTKPYHAKEIRMKRTVFTWIWVVLLIVSLLPVQVLGDEAKDQKDGWTFGLTPYLWLPSISGTINYNQSFGALKGMEVKVGPDNYLSNLSAVAMLSGEVRKGKWGVLSDVIYLDFSSEDSNAKAAVFNSSGRIPINTSLNTGTKSTLEGLVWNLFGSYRLVEGSTLTLDGVGGVRYFGLKASTEWQLAAAVNGPGPGQTLARSGRISEREDIWDAVVGIRGRVALGNSHWFVPYHFDVGTGTSIVTWQGLLGIGYSFGRVEGLLAYRHLSYSQGGDKLAQDLTFSGPGLGVVFRF